ncbi:hypothetical protein EVAR_27045_1 [Eumeta japonica]|uniref:Uncharacterized protein n=1 Tax=Eumeta variegata TaxID=151549 RepID=A0A4C1WE51_EUMVA|nr:hypothetical protein EVAR_27045_1 [Eumeta japonica]
MADEIGLFNIPTLETTQKVNSRPKIGKAVAANDKSPTAPSSRRSTTRLIRTKGEITFNDPPAMHVYLRGRRAGRAPPAGV